MKRAVVAAGIIAAVTWFVRPRRGIRFGGERR